MQAIKNWFMAPPKLPPAPSQKATCIQVTGTVSGSEAVCSSLDIDERSEGPHSSIIEMSGQAPGKNVGAGIRDLLMRKKLSVVSEKASTTRTSRDTSKEKAAAIKSKIQAALLDKNLNFYQKHFLENKKIQSYILNGSLDLETAKDLTSEQRLNLLSRDVQKYIDNGLLRIDRAAMLKPAQKDKLVFSSVQTCLDHGDISIEDAFNSDSAQRRIWEIHAMTKGYESGV